jgi:hypothetical protein
MSGHDGCSFRTEFGDHKLATPAIKLGDGSVAGLEDDDAVVAGEQADERVDGDEVEKTAVSSGNFGRRRTF